MTIGSLPRIVHDDGRVTVWHGNALHVLPQLPARSIDAVTCDPPYELGFMGKGWDASGIAYDVGMWAECLRVLKPGGHLLAFGGTRTSHRLTCAIEDAGFEIRDTITWLYGSGFPKSLDVSRAIDKAAGAEREVIGYRRNLNRTVRRDEAAAFHASEGGMFREDRETFPDTAPATVDAARWQGWGTALKPASEPIVVARRPLAGTVAGNVLTYGTGALNIDACRVGTDSTRRAGTKLTSKGLPGGGYGHPDAQRTLTGEMYGSDAGRWPSNVVLTHQPLLDDDGEVIGDACADRCVPGCPVADLDAQSGAVGSFLPAGRLYDGRDETRKVYGKYDKTQPFGYGDRGGASRCAGSGTTGEAALFEGFDSTLIEREVEYLPLILDRLTKRTDPVAHLVAKARRGEDIDLGLFADLEGA